MTDFLQQLANGVAAGCIYALVALGFVLVYKATEVVSLAHGDFMMLGAFMALSFVMQWGAPYWVGGLLAMAAVALVTVVIDRTVLRPMLNRPVFTLIMATLGIGMCIRGIVMLVPAWGTEPHKVVSPLSGTILRAGGVILTGEAASIIVVSIALVTVLFLFFRFTLLGTAMQATAQNRVAATYMGVNVNGVYTLIWGLSGAVAAGAGVLLAPVLFVHANMDMLGLKVLPAAVIGGLGSLPGAIVGGLIVGIVEMLAGFYLPEGFKEVAAYVVVLLVLAVRPTGVCGSVHTKRV